MSDAIQVGFGPLKIRITELASADAPRGKEFDLLRIRVKHVQQLDVARGELQAALSNGEPDQAALVRTLGETLKLVLPAITDEEIADLEVETISQVLDLAGRDAASLRQQLKATASETTAPASD